MSDTFATCYHCGGLCSGDVTETIEVDGVRGEVPVCDDPSECTDDQVRG